VATGEKVIGASVLLPDTGDVGTQQRRELYADALAHKVSWQAPNISES
jgi:hypothetical protein